MDTDFTRVGETQHCSNRVFRTTGFRCYGPEVTPPAQLLGPLKLIIPRITNRDTGSQIVRKVNLDASRRDRILPFAIRHILVIILWQPLLDFL